MTDSGPIDERYETFLRCFAQERDRVFAYVQSLLPHRADAEDVFQ
jgi:DNA-directed RNA polymerase specialized sigma24 family protein